MKQRVKQASHFVGNLFAAIGVLGLVVAVAWLSYLSILLVTKPRFDHGEDYLYRQQMQMQRTIQNLQQKIGEDK